MRVQPDGVVTSSHTTVTGFGTRFKSDVKAGDVIELEGGVDARVVAFVLTDTHLALKEAFYDNVKPPGVKFSVIRVVDHRKIAPIVDVIKNMTPDDATGVSANRFRVPKEGAKGVYVFESAGKSSGGGALSREELLDIRCKRKYEKIL